MNALAKPVSKLPDVGTTIFTVMSALASEQGKWLEHVRHQPRGNSAHDACARLQQHRTARASVRHARKVLRASRETAKHALGRGTLQF